MKIEYGSEKNKIVIENAWHSSPALVIPFGDAERMEHFRCTDPCIGEEKFVFVTDDYGKHVCVIAEHSVVVYKDISGFYNIDSHDLDQPHPAHVIASSYMFPTQDVKIKHMHSCLTLPAGGSWSEKRIEEGFVLKYLKQTYAVLEINAGYGRLSCIIASVLSDSKNLVAVETDSSALLKNKFANGFAFSIERDLSFYRDQEFNALVCDSGVHSLIDSNPSFFKDVDVVILKNDFSFPKQKKFVDAALVRYGLVVYECVSSSESAGIFANRFYEVWKRPIMNLSKMFSSSK